MASAVEMLFGQLNAGRNQVLDENRLAEAMRQFNTSQTQNELERAQRNEQFNKTYTLNQDELNQRKLQWQEGVRQHNEALNLQIGEQAAKGYLSPVDITPTETNLVPGMLGVVNPPPNAINVNNKLWQFNNPDDVTRRQFNLDQQLKQDASTKVWAQQRQLLKDAGIPDHLAAAAMLNPNVLNKLGDQSFEFLNAAITSGNPQRINAALTLLNRLVEAKTPASDKMLAFAQASNAQSNADLHRFTMQQSLAAQKGTEILGNIAGKVAASGSPVTPGNLYKAIASDASLSREDRQLAFFTLTKESQINNAATNPLAALFGGAVGETPANPVKTPPDNPTPTVPPGPPPMTRLPNNQRYTIRGDMGMQLVDPQTNTPILSPNGKPYVWQNNQIVEQGSTPANQESTSAAGSWLGGLLDKLKQPYKPPTLF